MNIKNIFDAVSWRKKSDSNFETPMIDSLVSQGVNMLELKMFVKKYGHILSQGANFEAFELFRTNKFANIKTTGEALNEGQQCLESFLRRFWKELELYETKSKLSSQGSEHDPFGID